MNRQERRQREKQFRKMGASKAEVEMFKELLKSAGILKEGDKVRLNYDKIIKEKGYEERLDGYRDFVENNKDTIFTVAYDGKFKNTKEPTIVTLAEDTNDPKWLWYVNDLILVKE